MEEDLARGHASAVCDDGLAMSLSLSPSHHRFSAGWGTGRGRGFPLSLFPAPYFIWELLRHDIVRR